jgi:hypothetical protein
MGAIVIVVVGENENELAIESEPETDSEIGTDVDSDEERNEIFQEMLKIMNKHNAFFNKNNKSNSKNQPITYKKKDQYASSPIPIPKLNNY